MKKSLLLFIMFFYSQSFGATGWFDDFITINGTPFYIGTGSGTELNGHSFGTILSLDITAVDMKYWADGGDNRTGGAFYWEIRTTSNENVKGPYEVIWNHAHIIGNDYQGTWSGDIDVFTSGGNLVAGTSYQLHVWAKSWGTLGGDSWLSNDGNNYVATFTIDNVWPVELSSFSANINNNSINLKWQTATEQNNYGFEIERSQKFVVSSKSTTWQSIGFVNGSGNSNSPKEYSYTDNSLNNSGKYSYRLKQVDNDGSHEYSSIVEVDYNPVITFDLEQNYPNPFNPNTVINYSLAEPGFVTIKVYNMLGEEVTTLVNGQMEAGRHTLQFSATGGASKLSSGMYLYKITAGNFTQVKKMLLTK